MQATPKPVGVAGLGSWPKHSAGTAVAANTGTTTLTLIRGGQPVATFTATNTHKDPR